MKLFTGRILPFIITIAVLLTGIILPRLFFRRMQQRLIGKTTTLSADEVSPYGSAAGENRWALRKVLEQINSAEASQDNLICEEDGSITVAEPEEVLFYITEEEWKDREQAVWKSAFPRMVLFLEECGITVSDQGYRTLVYIMDEPLVCLLSAEEADWNEIAFDAKTGIPLVLYCELADIEPEVFWNGYLAALSSIYGLVFQTTESKINPLDFYDYDQSFRAQAVSADKSFVLTASFFPTGSGFYSDIALTLY